MKNGTLTLLLCLLVMTGVSQSFWFMPVVGRATLVDRERLRTAGRVSDVVQYYPTSQYFFFNYVSIEVATTCEGKAVTAVSANDVLTPEQKNLLTSSDPGFEIVIRVNFKLKGAPAEQKTEQMEYVVMAGLEKEAEYPGGHKQMTSYLNENVIDKIKGKNASATLPWMVVEFTVNESGAITDVELLGEALDPAIGKMLFDAFTKMPKWKPAENAKGISIKQKFSLSIGARGC